MGFSGVIAGRNAVFVCKLARYDFAGERGYFCTDAFATGKHKHEARKQQNCRKGRGDRNREHAALHGLLFLGLNLDDARCVARIARMAGCAIDARRIRLGVLSGLAAAHVVCIGSNDLARG